MTDREKRSLHKHLIQKAYTGELDGIRGTRISGEPADESEHFYTCPQCGAMIDKRDLAGVFRHEAGHGMVAKVERE